MLTTSDWSATASRRRIGISLDRGHFGAEPLKSDRQLPAELARTQQHDLGLGVVDVGLPAGGVLDRRSLVLSVSRLVVGAGPQPPV